MGGFFQTEIQDEYNNFRIMALDIWYTADYQTDMIEQKLISLKLES